MEARRGAHDDDDPVPVRHGGVSMSQAIKLRTPLPPGVLPVLARSVRAGDRVIGDVAPDGTVDLLEDPYDAAPEPYNPQCGCFGCEPVTGPWPHVVLTGGFPWDVHDVWGANDSALIVPVARFDVRLTESLMVHVSGGGTYQGDESPEIGAELRALSWHPGRGASGTVSREALDSLAGCIEPLLDCGESWEIRTARAFLRRYGDLASLRIMHV
jgi:hypothetical protein